VSKKAKGKKVLNNKKICAKLSLLGKEKSNYAVHGDSKRNNSFIFFRTTTLKITL